MFQNNLIILIVAIIVGYIVFSNIQRKKKSKQLIFDGAKVIDVRSRDEFKSGCNKESINIPLDELNNHLAKLDPQQLYVLCCASGARSQSALAIMKSAGFQKLFNAGSWTNTLK